MNPSTIHPSCALPYIYLKCAVKGNQREMPTLSPEVFLHKSHVPHAPPGAGEVGEGPCLFPEVAGDLRRAEKLAFFLVAAVRRLHAVLVIAQKRMPDMRHLTADLMGTAGDEVTLHERKTAPVRKTFVLCDGRLRSLHRVRP